MNKAQKFCLHILAEGEQQQLMVYWIAPCFLELLGVFLWAAENLVLCAGLTAAHSLLCCQFGVGSKSPNIAMKGVGRMARKASHQCIPASSKDWATVNVTQLA